MKKHLITTSSLLFLVLYSALNAQTYITIGEGDTTTYDVPVNGSASTGWAAALYQQEEIDLAGTISHIAFLIGQRGEKWEAKPHQKI